MERVKYRGEGNSVFMPLSLCSRREGRKDAISVLGVVRYHMVLLSVLFVLPCKCFRYLSSNANVDKGIT